MEQETIGGMIDRYRIEIRKLDGVEMIGITKNHAPKEPEELERLGQWMRENKPAVIDELHARRQAIQDKYKREKEFRDSISGLRQIEHLRYLREPDERALHDWYETDMASPMPTSSVDYTARIHKLLDENDLARARLDAEEKKLSPDYETAGIGDKAEQRLYEGKDPLEVEQWMRDAEHEFALRHLWD
ncbi:MAG: hypothetical protein LKI77_06885 [Bifidobacterium sp.]|jgi:hypothetical protein|nr:hypothetical protein [Bifidobacterium sp.]